MVTGTVSAYEPCWNSTAFPVVYPWRGGLLWTMATTDECTVLTSPASGRPAWHHAKPGEVA